MNDNLYTAANEGRALRPLVGLDVDEVLILHEADTAERLGYRPHRYQGPSPTGTSVAGIAWMHPDHGGWVRELAQAADIVWCTSWRHLASTWVAEQLGLPTGWPYITDADAEVRWGRSLKLMSLFTYAGERPLAVLDNQYGGKDDGFAEYRTDEGKPTLLVRVDGTRGLRRTDVDQVLTWLSSL